ncbi:MAG: hypothetical protein IJZ35_08715 [Clostridia bacterium]|nr:hypothetical protein [Clostridia bacterium]
MNFAKLQLNDEVKMRLSSAIDSGTLSHAVLLTGGTEKERKELSLLLAQALLCENGEKPCLKCSSCKKIKSGIHPDVTIVSGEAGKLRSIKIDTIRSIRNQAYIVPNEAPFQIFIILEASGMGEEAQNALLKILEEPPATARFILASRSRDDFRQTILSRVTPFAISEDSGQAAGEKENPKASAAAKEILSALATGNEYKIIVSTGALEKDKKTYKATLEKMLLMLRNAVVAKFTDIQTDGDGIENKLSAVFSPKELLNMQTQLKELLTDADKNANDNLLLTRLSIKLMSCIYKQEA